MSFSLNLKISKDQKIKYIKDQFLTCFQNNFQFTLNSNFPIFHYSSDASKTKHFNQTCVTLSFIFDNSLTTPPAHGERSRSFSQDILYPLSFDNSLQTAPPACGRLSF